MPDLHWLPRHADLRGTVTRMKGQADVAPEALGEQLARLANHRMDYLETLSVDRLVRSTLCETPAGWPEVRLALLGSSSVEHLLPPITVGGIRRRLRILPFVGGFGQYRQELLSPSSEIRSFAPHVVLLALQPTDLMATLPLAASLEQVEGAIARSIEALVALWRVARQEQGVTVVQQTLLDTGEALFGNFDGLVAASPRNVVDRLNQAIRNAAASEGVLVLDLAHWAERHGRDTWFDPVRWHYAKQIIAQGVAVVYGDLVARLLGALRGRSSKCLVFDLDNTLWGGVIGDDGLDGIVLGQGHAVGEAFLAFQSFAKQLSERGVILAVCSKNDPEIAASVFREHPEMVLKLEDIAAFVANWQDKPTNLRQIARMLNIGLDSLVFFDDNPAEREIVRQNIPEIAVPEVPSEVTGFARCLAEGGWFEAISFTREDQQRSQQYLENRQRETALSSATNMDDFLASLEMRMIATPFNSVDLPRITQLAHKTNQFNVTTRRYHQEQMAAFRDDRDAVTLSFRLIDKFGDNGLICAVIALPDRDYSEALRIDTWLMSCRVLGRQVEEEVINQLCLIARDRGYSRLIGEYVPTAKNGLVRDLYRRVGFQQISPDGDTNTLWSMVVPHDVPYRTFIDVDARHQPATAA